MSLFLKTKEIKIDEHKITITQLSGLERYDYLDYLTDIPRPVHPVRPEEGASEEESDNYLHELSALQKAWNKVMFIGASRLVAYGCKHDAFDIEDLEERHIFVQENLSVEQINILHREIAEFSGIPIPELDEEESAETDENQTETKDSSEPVDPKQ